MKNWTFDGATLGLSFPAFSSKTGFPPPTDIDPINDGARSVVLFAAKPHRGVAFPEHTSVVLFTTRPLVADDPDAVVNTICWMGGTYFHERSDFPVHLGCGTDEVIERLGEPVEVHEVTQRGLTLSFMRHDEDTYSVHREGRVVILIVGEMPPMPFGSPPTERRAEWGGVVSTYLRLTPAAG